MLTKAKITLEITDALNGLPPDERAWALRRCREYVQQERRLARDEVVALQGAGTLTAQVEQRFQTRAQTFAVLERVLGLLERLSGGG